MSTSAWVPGAQLDEYRLLEQLGAGGMGAVWRVEHLPTGAIRALKATFADEGVEIERFQREARALASLQHPNVTRVHTAGVHHGRRYLVLDLAPGGDLGKRLKSGPLDPEHARRLAHDLALGLAHVHARGILHRDLKPQNVLFAEDGRPLLADFGLARRVDGSSLTRTGAVLGTPSYMPPEQADGSGAIDERCDVYGLGAVLYHALTGEPPHRGGSALAVLQQVLRAPVKPPSRLNPAVPPGLEAVCLKALAKDPEQRYPSARALADALAAPPAPRAPGGLRLLAACAALSALLALTALWLSLNPAPPPPEPPPKTAPLPAQSAPAPELEPTPAASETAWERFVASLPEPDPDRDFAGLKRELSFDPHVLYELRGLGTHIAIARDLLVDELDQPALAAAWLYHLGSEATPTTNYGVAWRFLGELLERNGQTWDVSWGEADPAADLQAVIRESFHRGAEADDPKAMLKFARHCVFEGHRLPPCDPQQILAWLRKAWPKLDSDERDDWAVTQAVLVAEHPKLGPAPREVLELLDAEVDPDSAFGPAAAKARVRLRELIEAGE